MEEIQDKTKKAKLVIGKPDVERENKKIFRPRDLETAMFSVDVTKIFHGILRHIPLILAFALVCAVAGSYISHRLSNLHYSQAVLIYQKDSPGYEEIEFQLLKLTMPSAVEMITLPVHMKAVKSLLGLDLSVEQIQGMVTVEPPLKDSNLITLTVKANNPNLAISVANTLAQVVVQNSRELNEKQWQEAYNFFKNEEIQLRRALEEQEKDLLAFRKEHKYIGVDPQLLSPLQKLSRNEQQLQAINIEFTKAKSEYDSMLREYNSMPDTIEAPSEEEQLLKQRVSKLEESILTAQAKYASENPKLKGLETQLRRLRDELILLQEDEDRPKNLVPNPAKEAIRLQLIALQSRMEASEKLKEQMTSVVGDMRSNIGNLTQEQLELIALTNKKVLIDMQIKSAVDRQRAIRVIQNLGKSDLELYEKAAKAFTETIPFMVILLPSIGFMIGALLGMGAASVLELSDRKYRTPKELDNVFTIPTLATIPQRRRFRRFDADDDMIYYMRSISERINRLPQFPQVVNITSSTRREGKSTLAHYLAKYYTKLGKKTVILCLDQSADAHHDEESKPAEDLEAYLRGSASLDDIIFRGPPDKITCHNDSEMQELLQTERYKKLMEQLRANYDLIVIDAPGVIEEVYTINLTDQADATLFVIGSSKVTRKYINCALKRMEEYGVKPDGFILNRVLPVYVDDVYFRAQMRKSHRWTLLGR